MTRKEERQKDELFVRRVLDLLGVQYLERGNRLAMHCPFHDDRDPSAAFYLDTGLFHCFSDNITTDAIGFYARFTEQPKKDAIRDLEKSLGPIEEKWHRANQHLLALIRARAETVLAQNKHLPMQKHAYLGETLDRILLAYERGQVDEGRLDNLLGIWYNKLSEGANEGLPVQPGTTKTDLDARLEEGFGDILGYGRQGNQRTVAAGELEDTIDLA